MKINNPIKKLIESYSRKQREDSIAHATPYAVTIISPTDYELPWN